MLTKGIIHCRAGSERVPRKNSRPFAGSSLLEIKIEQLLRIPELDGVIVNTDDADMLAAANRMGCEAIARRPGMADGATPINEVYRSIAEDATCDLIVWSPCIAPMVRDGTITRCIQAWYAHCQEHVSVTTATPVQQFLWCGGHAVNYDPSHQPRSQDLDGIMALTFGCSVVLRSHMMAQRSPVGVRPWLQPIPEDEAIDIDTLDEFERAEWLYLRRIAQRADLRHIAEGMG